MYIRSLDEVNFSGCGDARSVFIESQDQLVILEFETRNMPFTWRYRHI